MGKLQKAWARRARAKLLTELGAKCAHCGEREALGFDCISPRGDRHHKMDTSARMSFYRGEHRLGNLQVLCSECNRRKGDYSEDELARVRVETRQQEQSPAQPGETPF